MPAMPTVDILPFGVTFSVVLQTHCAGARIGMGALSRRMGAKPDDITCKDLRAFPAQSG